MRSNRRQKSRRRITKALDVIKKIIKPLIILIAVIVPFTIFAFICSINEKVISGIKVNNIDISNLTINESYDKLKNNLEEKKSKNIKIKQGEYETTISLEQLEVNYKISEAISDAYKIGRNKNIIVSNFQVISTMFFNKNIEKEIEINEEELDKMIDDISSKIPDLLVESSYCIEDSNLVISSGKAGYSVKKSEFKDKVTNAIINQIKGEDSGVIDIPVEKVSPKKIDIEKIQKEIYQNPKNAYYEETPFKVYKEENGIDLNITIEEAKSILEEEKEEYIIPLKITKPEVALQDLKYENFFPNQLSKFLTRYDESNINRSTNIKLATEKINNIILMPGETFSYNKTVGARTVKAGYKEASVYMNGQVVDGIGGGICQVSSTLYNAVLEANLEISSRKSHYFVTGYVTPSRDATVSYGTIDFQFKNTRSYPIKLVCDSKNGICQIEIYGIKEDQEYEVEIQDKVTETIPYNTKYIETAELETGIEEEVQKGVNGYKSEAYRILKLNGKEISRTLLSKDSYNPLDRIIKKGK